MAKQYKHRHQTVGYVVLNGGKPMSLWEGMLRFGHSATLFPNRGKALTAINRTIRNDNADTVLRWTEEQQAAFRVERVTAMPAEDNGPRR